MSIYSEVVTISPEKPKVGDVLSITYDAKNKNSVLKNETEITMYAYIERDTESPILKEIEMKKSGNKWSSEFTLDQKNALMIQFVFHAEDDVDNNDEINWDVLIYDQKNNPVKGALVARALSFLGRSNYLKRSKDIAQAKNDLDREISLYGVHNLNVKFAQWNILLLESKGNDEGNKKIENEIDAEYKKVNDESNKAILASWYARVGNKKKTEQLQKEIIKEFPNGSLAQNARIKEERSISIPEKKIAFWKKAIRDFPGNDQFKEMLVYAFINEKKYDDALQTLNEMKKPNGSMYNKIAWDMINSNKEIDRATEIARKGIELIRSTNADSKPSWQSKKEWQKNNNYSLGMILDTYAFGLFTLGKYDDAVRFYNEAIELTELNSPDIAVRLAECYTKLGQKEKALAVYQTLIRKGKSDEKILKGLKDSYVAARASENGYKEMLNGLKNEAHEVLLKEVEKKVINKPNIPFSVKDLNGNQVTLSDLNGKVVVVDFWATWCGPCKASFPFLEKVYQKFKDNPSVQFVVIGTGWSEDTEDKVIKFIKETKYTFPVAQGVGIAEEYGVEGIPTKFLIDKNGKIRFKEVGYNGPQMEEELTAQIEMLLSNDFYLKN